MIYRTCTRCGLSKTGEHPAYCLSCRRMDEDWRARGGNVRHLDLLRASGKEFEDDLQEGLASHTLFG
jgi:hypothetical protein